MTAATSTTDIRRPWSAFGSRRGFRIAALLALVLAPAAASAQTTLNLVAVGISRYRMTAMNLNYSAKDAQDLTRAVRGNRLFSGGQLTLLTDQQATVRNILSALSLLQRRATSQTFTILFLSGHGGRDAHGHFYYPAHEYDPRRMAATSISCEQLQAALHRIPGRVFLIIDACHSGSSGSHKHGGHWVSPANHMVTISSSIPQQQSLEMGRIQNGAFTRAFLEAMVGSADFNRDRVVSLAEMHGYVQRRVLALTGGRQSTATYVPNNAYGALKMAVLSQGTPSTGVVVWRGRENLQGFGALAFTFHNGGRIVMTDTRGQTQGTWTAQGGVVTLRFNGGRVVYTGRISGRNFSGTAANGRTRWQFAVTRS